MTKQDPAGPCLRPADVLLRAWLGGKDTAVDVTVRHPLHGAPETWTAEKATAFLRKAESQKREKFSQCCSREGWAFVPAALDTWGGVGPACKDLIAKLLSRAVGAVAPRVETVG